MRLFIFEKHFLFPKNIFRKVGKNILAFLMKKKYVHFKHCYEKDSTLISYDAGLLFIIR
jgi:hypothetical protein